MAARENPLTFKDGLLKRFRTSSRETAAESTTALRLPVYLFLLTLTEDVQLWFKQAFIYRTRRCSLALLLQAMQRRYQAESVVLHPGSKAWHLIKYNPTVTFRQSGVPQHNQMTLWPLSDFVRQLAFSIKVGFNRSPLLDVKLWGLFTMFLQAACV